MSTIDLLRRNGDEESFFLPTPYTPAELIAASQRFARDGDIDTAARFLSATGTITFADAWVRIDRESEEQEDSVLCTTKKRGVTKRYQPQYGRYPLRRSVRMAMNFFAKLTLEETEGATRTLRNGKMVRTTPKKEPATTSSGILLAF